VLTEVAKAALEFLKLAPRYIVTIAVIAGLLLFLPSGWLKLIGVEAFAQANRQWLGLTFLISTIIWLVAVVAALWAWAKGQWQARKVQQHVIRRLQSLTEDEKQILRYYYTKGTRANTLKVDDGVVQGLVASRIIYRSASMGNLVEGFAHNITDLAWDYIHQNPAVLEGSTNVYRTDKDEHSNW
jgi:membrane protein implicated in regulation of membrane protease activity